MFDTFYNVVTSVPDMHGLSCNNIWA